MRSGLRRSLKKAGRKNRHQVRRNGNKGLAAADAAALLGTLRQKSWLDRNRLGLKNRLKKSPRKGRQKSRAQSCQSGSCAAHAAAPAASAKPRRRKLLLRRGAKSLKRNALGGALGALNLGALALGALLALDGALLALSGISSSTRRRFGSSQTSLAPSAGNHGPPYRSSILSTSLLLIQRCPSLCGSSSRSNYSAVARYRRVRCFQCRHGSTGRAGHAGHATSIQKSRSPCATN